METKSKSLINVKSKSKSSLSLPLLVLYTQNGSIPFLSWNFIRSCNNGVLFKDNDNGDDEINLVKLNVGDFYEYLDVSSDNNNNNNLSSLKYFKNCSFLLTIFDPLQQPLDTYYKCTNEQIAIDTYHGKKMLSVNDVLKLCQTIGVEHVQSIADIITPPIAGRKWLTKSVNRTEKYLQDTVQNLFNNNNLKIWATLTGGYNSECRQRACKQLSKYSDKLYAIIIDGFFGYNIDDSVENEENFIKTLRNDIISNLPENIPKALFGILYPDQILRLIKLGIDIFDCSICTMLTQKGYALPSPLLMVNNEPKLLFKRNNNNQNETIIQNNDPNPSIILNLNDTQLFKSNNLLISNRCHCYTCLNGFTRAYLNHLLKRKEINASILIQIHNHYVMTEFFSDLKKIITNGLFEQLLVNSIDNDVYYNNNNQ